MERNPQRTVLTVLCSAQLVEILDISVVNVALVPLADDLHIGRVGLQLVAAVYAATFGGVPLVVVIVLSAYRVLPGDLPAGGRLADSAVSVGMAGGGCVVLLVIGLSFLQAGQRGLAVVLLALSVALLLTQRRVDRRLADPLVSTDVLSAPWVRQANVIAVLLSAVVLGVNYFLAMHLQGLLGLGPLTTGLAFLPITLISGTTAVLAARSVATSGVAPQVQGTAAALLSTSTQVGAATGVALGLARPRRTDLGSAYLGHLPARTSSCLPGCIQTATATSKGTHS